VDEGLELDHRALRIALGEERPSVVYLKAGGFCRKARLGHRVPEPLHPGIAFAEAAGPFQIIAKRLAQRRGGLVLLIGDGPADGGAVVGLFATRQCGEDHRIARKATLETPCEKPNLSARSPACVSCDEYWSPAPVLKAVVGLH